MQRFKHSVPFIGPEPVDRAEIAAASMAGAGE